MRRATAVTLWAVATVVISGGVAAGVVALHDRSRSTQTPDVAPPAIRRATVDVGVHEIQPVLSLQGAVESADGRFRIVATVSPADQAYRLVSEPVSLKAAIIGGPAGFPCAWLGLQPTSDGVAARCEIPTNVKVVAGLPAEVVIALQRPFAASALPTSAVVGSSGQGSVVVVVPGGRTTVKQVQLGTSDDQWVQIVSGLSSRDRVLRYPIQSDLSGG